MDWWGKTWRRGGTFIDEENETKIAQHNNCASTPNQSTPGTPYNVPRKTWAMRLHERRESKAELRRLTSNSSGATISSVAAEGSAYVYKIHGYLDFDPQTLLD
jgi:hypothetical protein